MLKKIIKMVVFIVLIVCLSLTISAKELLNRSTPVSGLYIWPTNLRNVYVRYEDYTGKYGNLEGCFSNSLETWNEVRASNGSRIVNFIETSDLDCVNTVEFDPYLLDEGVIARMYPNPTNGYMETFQILLNNGSYQFSNGAYSGKVDFQSVVTHELGHALGVSHCHNASESTCGTSQCPYNVMNPTLSLGQARRTLMNYDISTYRALYR